MLSDTEIDAVLSELDERRGATAAEMRRAEDAAAEMRRLEATRGSLASADWFEDPDAVRPGEWLTLGARPEEVRRAYQRFDARFELDQHGELKLRLEVSLGGEGVANRSHREGCNHEYVESADKEEASLEKEVGRAKGISSKPRCTNLVLVHRAFQLFRDGAYLRPRGKVVSGSSVVCVGLDFRGSYLDKAKAIR